MNGPREDGFMGRHCLRGAGLFSGAGSFGDGADEAALHGDGRQTHDLTGENGIHVEPDKVYGDVAHRFLPQLLPGLLGIFIASLLASVMSSCTMLPASKRQKSRARPCRNAA